MNARPFQISLLLIVLASSLSVPCLSDYGATIRCYGEGGWESKPYALFEEKPRDLVISGSQQYKCTVIIVHRERDTDKEYCKGIVNPGVMKHQWWFQNGNPDHYDYELNTQVRWSTYNVINQETYQVKCQAQKQITSRESTSAAINGALSVEIAKLGFTLDGSCSIDIVNGHDMGTVVHDLWIMPCCDAFNCPRLHGGLCNCEFLVCPVKVMYLVLFENIEPAVAIHYAVVCSRHTGMCDPRRCTNYKEDVRCTGSTCQHCNRCTVCGLVGRAE